MPNLKRDVFETPFVAFARPGIVQPQFVEHGLKQRSLAVNPQMPPVDKLHHRKRAAAMCRKRGFGAGKQVFRTGNQLFGSGRVADNFTQPACGFDRVGIFDAFAAPKSTSRTGAIFSNWDLAAAYQEDCTKN